MAVDFEGLRAFVIVAELGSFNAAAEALNISAPGLTRRVQKLERALGIELLERTTRHVGVTGLGREFLPKARKLLDDLDGSLSSIREFAGRRSGQVAIACVPTAAYYFLPPVIADFNAQFPKVKVRIIDENANAVIHRVTHQEADFGITFFGGRDADLEFEHLLEDPYLLACRHDHPLASREQIEWRDLTPYRFATANRLSGNRLVIDRALQATGWQPDWFYEVLHLPTALGLVEAGLAVVALPRLALPSQPHPLLVSRPLINPVVKRDISLIRRRGVPLSPTAQVFFEILRKRQSEMSERGSSASRARV